jgi:hypothetical protein
MAERPQPLDDVDKKLAAIWAAAAISLTPAVGVE